MVFIIETVSIDEIKERIQSIAYKVLKPRIFKAIEDGDDLRVIKLATRKRLRSSKGFYGESPLVACIQKGKSELACKLIASGGYFEGDGSLINASMCGDQKVVDCLLKNGANPDDVSGNSEYHEGHTPLMWATNRHHFGIIKSLLAAGASINAVAKDNTTAVMYTRNADANDLVALKILLGYKPDISIRDWRGRNLIQEAQDQARCSAKPEMLTLITKYYPELEAGNA